MAPTMSGCCTMSTDNAGLLALALSPTLNLIALAVLAAIIVCLVRAWKLVRIVWLSRPAAERQTLIILAMIVAITFAVGAAADLATQASNPKFRWSPQKSEFWEELRQR